MMDTFLFLFPVITVCIYALIVIHWFIAWNLFPRSRSDVRIPDLKVSVLVAVRNESENIKVLLNDLILQSYPSSQFEIIITDDHSEDDTVRLAEDFIRDKQSNAVVSLLKSENDGKGKKAALNKAVLAAEGEVILITDADCRVGRNWVQSMVQQFSNPDVDMVTGWVKIEPDKRFFSKLQAFEFLSLAATGATSVIADSPLMCNGANLAYRKRVFTEQGGFSYGSESPSGDDTFLMLAVAKSGRGKVVFCNNPEAAVSTKPLNDWRAFIFQRIRWGGKVKHYREKYIGRYGLLIFMANLMLLLLPLMALAGKVDVAYAIMLWSFKVFADMLLLMKAANFSKQQYLLWLFLPASIFYPLYAVAGSLLSMIPVQYEWKNRKW